MQYLPEGAWKYQSDNPGPTITILGGIHGNELTGIEVVKKLRDQFDSSKLKLKAGRLFLMLGNVCAIDQNKRSCKIECDLNRQFTTSNLENPPQDFYESKRAQEIAEVLRESDICLDLHATNKPSEPFVCTPTMTDEKLEIIKRFGVDRVLIDPNYILGGEPAATDEFMETQGKIGICFETGWAKDTSRVDEVMRSVLDVLADQQVIEGDQVVRYSGDQVVKWSGDQEVEVYQLAQAIKLTEEGWRFADGFGEKNFEGFAGGQVIGYLGDQVVRYSGNQEFRVDFDGVIVFPKIKEHWHAGAPVGYLAKRV